MPNAPEEKLAAAVSAWLVADGWEVYPEVQLARSCPRADLVALRRSIGVAWVIACKTTFGFAVLEQAMYWAYEANWISIAIPEVRRRGFKKMGSRIGPVAHRCLQNEGIGVLRVGKAGDVEIDYKARFMRKKPTRLLECCGLDHQRMGVAGSKYRFYTDFRATCEAAEAFVAAHPLCTIKELLAGIDYHWRSGATARVCVAKYLGRGVLGRIAVEPGSRPFRLLLRETEKE